MKLVSGLSKREPLPLTPDDIIMEQVKKHRPSMSGLIPADIEHRLEASHFAGKYHLTQEPFLIEGAKKILEWGSRVCKVWFDFNPIWNTRYLHYPFCSDWSALSPQSRLADIAKHPYYDAMFSLPFSTIILEITRFSNIRPFYSPNNNFSEYEEQFEELTEYLYSRFSGHPITFVLQNWEGDWLFRGVFETGNFEQAWNQQMMDDLPRRIDYFTRWFAARQKGVEKARKRLIGDQSIKCKVIHAVEVNQVMALLQGVPTLTELVLPNIAPDIVSWSSWDGMSSPMNLWHGIEIIRHFMKHSGFLSKPTVMVGEIGYPERGRTQEEIIDFWDRSLAVCFALDIPYVVHWEVYCNEPTKLAGQSLHLADEALPQDGIYSAEDLMGFWLYRPDGSLSYSGQFLRNLLHKSK